MGLTALLLLGGLVAYPAAAADRQPAIVIGLGAAAWAFALVGIAARWWPPVAAAAVVFGAEYAVYLRLDTEAVDVRAPLVAAALVSFVELAFRGAAFRGGRGEPSLLIRDAAAVAVAAFGTALVGGTLLVAAGTFGSNLTLEVLGAAAGVLAIGVVAQIVRLGSSTST